MRTAAALVLVLAGSAFAQAPATPEAGQACVSGPTAQVAAGEEPPFVRADVRSIAEKVTCYCGCPHLQVSKCFCGTAEAIRADFAKRLDEGATAEAVVAAYVAEHGPSILAVPPRRGFHWIIWLGPPALLVLGAALVVFAGRRWSRPSGMPELLTVPVDAEQEAKYRAALQRELEGRP